MRQMIFTVNCQFSYCLAKYLTCLLIANDLIIYNSWHNISRKDLIFYQTFLSEKIKRSVISNSNRTFELSRKLPKHLRLTTIGI